MRRRTVIDAVARMLREKPRETGIREPSLRATVLEQAIHRQMVRREAAERRAIAAGQAAE